MEMLVYILCALSSALCAVLLFRGYRRTPSRLLMWSAVCFFGLMLNNIILCVDFYLGPVVDLSILRAATATAAMLAMIYGLVWEVV